MGRKKARVPLHDSGFVYTDEVQVNGRWLRPGTEFTVTGEKGRFLFLSYVTNRNGVSWIDGRGPNKHFRSFYPDRVKTVHIHKRTRGNSGSED